MSPEGDTLHCQAVGRGGRRTGKGTLEKYLLLKKFTSAEYISGNDKKQRHYGITTFRRQSSETIVKSRKRFFPAQLV